MPLVFTPATPQFKVHEREQIDSLHYLFGELFVFWFILESRRTC